MARIKKNFCLSDVSALAKTLSLHFEKQGVIYPPAQFCTNNETCWLYIRKMQRLKGNKITELLSRIILDAKNPHMSIAEEFLVRERLAFAINLATHIDPECKDIDIENIPISSKDIKISIRGTTVNHFLFWLVDFVYDRLGEVFLQNKVFELVNSSNKLNLQNVHWICLRQDYSE